MRYYVTVAGRTLEVDLTGEAPVVDGKRIDADLVRVPGRPTLRLLADGRSHTVIAHRRGRQEWDLQVNGDRYEVGVVDERTRAIQAMTGQGVAPKGPRPVVAPMPGLVVRIAVEPGDHVQAGQSVVIIEAMKMENDLKAESDAVVARVAAVAGQAVEKGAVLVEFREEAEEGEGG